MMQPSAVELWEAIKAWYAEHLPEVLESLNPGVSKRALNEFEDELEREVGQRLPQSLRDVYLQNDGQDRTTICGVFFGLEFLSLENLIDDWNVWRDIASDPLNDDLSENSTSYPSGAVQTVYTTSGWIPFAGDAGGNHLGIDLSPGPAGQIGQVINFGRDEDNKFVIAPSFGAFLEWQLTQLQSGNFSIVIENYGEGPERNVVLRGCFGIGLPVSPRYEAGLSKALSNEVTTGEIDEGFARGGQGFVVFAEPAVVTQPGKGSFDDPASCL